MNARDNIVQILDAGFHGSISELSIRVGVTVATTKKHLNFIMSEGLAKVTGITGYIPSAEILVEMAEKNAGKINASTLMSANIETKRIVDQIAEPELKRNFVGGLKSFSDEVDSKLSLDLLFKYVSEEFLPFVNETNNGFVSIIGRLNEELILQSLRNTVLIEETDFVRTGKESAADIIVHERGGQKNNMYVEVKSYHARERLLRGLQDIPHPCKVGIGFFRDPKEFNPNRTGTLIDTNAWAVYMPQDTFDNIHEDSASQTTNQQNKFYRPFSMFDEDMISFSKSGTLKIFRH